MASMFAGVLLLTLSLAPPVAAQCQMIYNVSVYNDAAVSEDQSMVYGVSTTPDSNIPCTCGHGSYETRTTVYAPDGTQYVAASSGFASSLAVATNGRLGTWTVTGNARLFCSCAGLAGAGGVAASIEVQPAVRIQIEPTKQQGSSGFVLTGDTTALTATGYPAGGTFVWQAGPKLVLSGSATQPNVAVRGIEESSAMGDTWVQVTYTVGGKSATSSIRFTVREARRFAALNLGGPDATVPAPQGYGYITWITYQFRDQFGQAIELPNLAATEVLKTLTLQLPPGYQLTLSPADNTAKTESSNSMGVVMDALSASSAEPIPSGFFAHREQTFYLRGLLIPLQPRQLQQLYQRFATVQFEVMSW